MSRVVDCPSCGHAFDPSIRRLTLSLPPELVTLVRAKAAREARTVSSVIAEALRARKAAEGR